MPQSVSPSIDNLEHTWRSLIDLCASLSEEEWRRPTGCPGWSVQDNVSHLIDYEERALGWPAPAIGSVKRPHTKNALGQSNEVGVESRRRRSPTEVLEELRTVTAARAAQLRALTAEDLLKDAVTPAGPGTVADMLTLRVMDTWSHEQDIRRAIAQPGHGSGPAAAEAIGHFARFLPIIVAKRAAAPDGTVVVFDIGEVHRCAIEVVAGRAHTLDTDAASWTVRLTMASTTFAALVGGRSDAPDDVTIDGDAELGRKIVGALGFMP